MENRIRIDQTGVPAMEPIVFAVLGSGKGRLLNGAGQVVYEFEADGCACDAASGDPVQRISLPGVTEGTYRLLFENDERVLLAANSPWEELLRLLCRGFYFQRCGTELRRDFAGPYVHPECHLAPALLYENPSESISVTGGWHDAGDYGRYTGPGAVAVGHLLYAWMLYPDAFKLPHDLPESGNGVPDILNECRWELEWMLKMQRADGAVYHKVSKKLFAPFIMPQQDTETEYVFPPSHCATAAVSACFALASRVFGPYDAAFSEKLLSAAMKGRDYIRDHPEFVSFRNPDGVRTGWYGDNDMQDECFWMEAELYAAAGQEYDLREMEKRMSDTFLPDHLGWREVEGLGILCCLKLKERPLPEALRERVLRCQMKGAEESLRLAYSSGYGTALDENGYVWGSILPVLSRGICMLTEYERTGNEEMLLGALLQKQYMTGMNALDVCFVTGCGERSPQNIHHRPSGADGVEAPVPGLVSGGPNSRMNFLSTKEHLLPGTSPAKAWLDEMPSADTNEIAIYWNSPAVLLTAGLRHAWLSRRALISNSF